MKSIVIGGAGFIGSLVSQALIASGREVTVVGRRPPGAHTAALPCAYRCADLGNRAQMREILNPGCEVIDLAYATVPKTSYGDPVFDLFANLPGSVGLLEEAMAVGVRRLLLVFSGGTVFGTPCALPMAESHPTAPISPYGITKLTIDHYALMFHHTRDLPVVGGAAGQSLRSPTAFSDRPGFPRRRHRRHSYATRDRDLRRCGNHSILHPCQRCGQRHSYGLGFWGRFLNL